MKKISLYCVKIIGIVLLITSSFTVYAYTDWSKELIYNDLVRKENEIKVEKAYVEKKKEEKRKQKEERKKQEEEKKKQEEQNNYVGTTNYNSQPVNQISTFNSPVIGNIRIGGILYKDLVKDKNGEYFYLNHNIYGQYDGIGVPFVDFRTDFTGRKTLIYAHSSMAGNGPFNILQNYHYNPGFFQSNRYIDITYYGKNYRYEIFSVYTMGATDEHSDELEYFYYTKYSDEEWAETIQMYKNRSEYNTGVNVSGKDKILILQTCSMDPAYYKKYYSANILIMAKQV